MNDKLKILDDIEMSSYACDPRILMLRALGCDPRYGLTYRNQGVSSSISTTVWWTLCNIGYATFIKTEQKELLHIFEVTQFGINKIKYHLNEQNIILELFEDDEQWLNSGILIGAYTVLKHNDET